MPPKKRNRKRAPNRTSTRRPIAPTPTPAPRDVGAESDLADLAAMAGAGEDFRAELHEAVDARHPLELLGLASRILSALDSRASAPKVTVSDFADALLKVGTRQADALASVIGAMAGDDPLRERIRREVRARRLPMPGWVKRIDQIEPSRATAMTHPFGDGESIAVEVRLPDDRLCLVVAYVDHNLGTVVTNAFTMDDNLDHAVKHWHRADDASEDRDLSLAEARARLTEAIDAGATTVPPLTSETWPQCRRFVEWVVSMMPSGGTGYQRPEWSAQELADLTERFARSSRAAGLSEDDVRLVELFIDFATNHGSGDPLRWSPTSVELLLEWLPATVDTSPASLEAAPEVLRAFVSFSHEERGVTRDLTAQTLGAIEAHAPRFHDIVEGAEGDPSGQSAEANQRMQEIALRREVPRRGFPHAGQVGAR